MSAYAGLESVISPGTSGRLSVDDSPCRLSSITAGRCASDERVPSAEGVMNGLTRPCGRGRLALADLLLASPGTASGATVKAQDARGWRLSSGTEDVGRIQGASCLSNGVITSALSIPRQRNSREAASFLADLGMTHVEGFQLIEQVRRRRNPIVRRILRGCTDRLRDPRIV